MRLDGAVALVTGASSGIGRATALDLAAAGATVVGVARREPLLRDLAAEMARRGTPGETAVCDVTDAAAVERAVAGVVERHGRVDVLVNNAGVGLHRALRDCTVADLERVMRVNYLGAAACLLAVLPHMTARRRGVVVNVASIAGAIPWAWEAGYSASKAALIALSEASAPELARLGVHVCWVNPGVVRTDIFTAEAIRHLPPSAARTRLEPGRVSAAILDAVRRERASVIVPRSLAVAAVLRSVLPGPFRAGVRRTYEATLRRDRRGDQPE
jgi:short-subunit dehydrogenase